MQNIYALKRGSGLDYIGLPRPGQTAADDLPPPPDLGRPQVLKLDGARTVRIKLLDPEGRPIRDVGVVPWYFEKPESKTAL